MELLENAVHAGAGVESLKDLAKRSSSWTRFRDAVEAFIEQQNREERAARRAEKKARKVEAQATEGMDTALELEEMTHGEEG
jgi:hypothetical protein